MAAVAVREGADVSEVEVGEEDAGGVHAACAVAVAGDDGFALAGDDFLADGDAIGSVVGDFGFAVGRGCAGEPAVCGFGGALGGHAEGVFLAEVRPAEAADGDAFAVGALAFLAVFRPVGGDDHDGWEWSMET